MNMPLNALSNFKESFAVAAVFLLFGMLSGFYRMPYHFERHEFNRFASAHYVRSIPLIITILFFLPFSYLGHTFILICIFIVPVNFMFFRLLLDRFTSRFWKKGYGIYRSLVISDDYSWQEMIKRVRILPKLGYNIDGLIVWGVHGRQFRFLFADRFEDIPVDERESLEKFIKEKKIDRIFLSTAWIFDESKEELTSLCKKYNIKLKILTSEAEEMLVFPSIRGVTGITLIFPRRVRIDAAKCFLKRAFDIIVSLTALLILMPLLAIVVVLIYLEDRGPVFYSQPRGLAKGNGSFLLFKFRTMVQNAEEIQEKLNKDNRRSGGLFFVENDPRITKIGKFLRKYSIDELPQFFNVLKGDMSVVGPRPLAISDLDNITENNSMQGYYTLRTKLKPGLTGLWQISGRREVNFRKMVLLDLYYIDHHSLLYDIEIILRTIPVVLLGKGAY
jgi:exopolysaccharide biosynthesis polyprenyl glycosylphosphotransferase